ncbi:transglutaminase-like cysteine peptidase [Neorhizobium alkalisoli]|uniref:transglutaminase-like cysteine peptidase n=1 Tax=Neorhizobium alkalisoli TaxID=528178 RepID=UPI000CF9AC4B|nr:transglutaminase-like cysteine peptidase [Neorhizobium alkalisoli]
MSGRHFFKTLIIASVLCGSMAHTASAGPVSGLARPLRTVPQSQFITASRHTLAPFAFVRFCRDNREDCQASQGESIVDLSPLRRAELFRINAAVNRSMRPQYDNSSSDVWSVDVGSGDCEDYALTKRRKLIAAGWPARSLRMAVARTGAGEGHAVLVVKTSQGDLVLDNRTGMIRPWNRTDLTWEKIQSADNPRLWFDI